MFRSVFLSLLWFAAFVLLAFKFDPRKASPASGVTSPWCGAPGMVVNSFVAETQARRALGEPPFSPHPLKLYSLAMVDGGFIVRLGEGLSPRTVTLDGLEALMWVDASTGCVKVLSERR